jgi:hypothetical protein
VAGSLHEIEPAITEREGVAIPDGGVRKRRAGTRAKIDPRTGAFRKLAMAGYEVGVQMSFDDVLDLQTICAAASR